MYKKVLKKYETMEKGSRQRKMKFNPESVSSKERDMVQDWTSPAGTITEEKDKRNLREDIPKMDQNALSRGLHKIHKDTEVKKHPKTGERMFLLHRGMDDEEHGKLSGNNFLKDYTSSWTPDHKEASSMGYTNTVSAWIPESQIKSIPNAIGQKDRGSDHKMAEADYRSEKEIIVNPHQLITSKLQGIDDKGQLNREVKQMAQPAKMAASEKTYSQEEVIEMMRKSISDSLVGVENEGAEEILEKGLRNAFAKGLTVMAMIHGAHYMGQSPGKPSERMKSPTYQKVQEQREVKSRGPAEFKSDEEQIQQAYDDAQADAKSIIEKHTGKDARIKNFLQAIELNESSGGKNTKHKTMESGMHSGDTAIGNYGLMPNTVKEMVGTMGRSHPLFSTYRNMPNDQVESSLAQNPDHQKQIVTHMANRLHDKHGGDEERMAYSWFQGHNIKPDAFETGKHKDYQNHDYVQKFNKHKDQLNKTPSSESLASN